MRKWRSHFGQTLKFWSRSFFQMIWRHWSHLTQRPSVFTRFSPEVSSSPCSRLNHAIKVIFVFYDFASLLAGSAARICSTVNCGSATSTISSS